MWIEYLMYAVLPIFLLNLEGYLIAFWRQTDKLTDFSYSLSFLLAIAMYWLKVGSDSSIAILYSLLVTVWAFRLGGFLFWRIHRMGRDYRFDEMRGDPVRFAGFWILQFMTVAIMVVPLYFLDSGAIASTWTWLAIGLAIAFLILESVADIQKVKSKEKGEKPWQTGKLWSRIRHPNYTGEIGFWLSLSILCISGGAPWYMSLIPFLWIGMLLIFVSGIPLTEKSRSKRYGEQADYLKYMDSSWRLVPWVY